MQTPEEFYNLVEKTAGKEPADKLREMTSSSLMHTFLTKVLSWSKSPQEALLGLFVWEDTPEGHNYWQNVFFALVKGGQDDGHRSDDQA